MRTATLAFLALAVSAQSVHQHHPPRSSEEYARVLDNPDRDRWQKPHQVVTALNLRAEDAVADIGAGTGYFARRIARHAGTVFAVDLDRNLLKSFARIEEALTKAYEASHERNPGDAFRRSERKRPLLTDDFLFFGYVVGLEREWGYFRLSELESARGPWGFSIERDLWFKPKPVSHVAQA